MIEYSAKIRRKNKDLRNAGTLNKRYACTFQRLSKNPKIGSKVKMAIRSAGLWNAMYK